MTANGSAPFPSEGVDILLRDGSTARVRPAAPEDRSGMHSFLAALSPDSRRLRYFSGAANLDWAAEVAVEATYPSSYSLVATKGEGRIVANAMYARTGRALPWPRTPSRPQPRSRPAPRSPRARRAQALRRSSRALKAVAPTLVHKTEVGGVQLGISGDVQADRAARQMAAAVATAGRELSGFMVQGMAPQGVEMLVGVVHDPLFGPVIACGGGGTTAELINDVAVRITLLTDRDAGEMVRSLRTFPLLEGFRGAPKVDVSSLEDVLLRLAALVETHPEVAELDLNPVVVSPTAALVVDARIRVAESPPRPPWPSLGA